MGESFYSGPTPTPTGMRSKQIRAIVIWTYKKTYIG
jgi:hypothetical protein